MRVIVKVSSYPVDDWFSFVVWCLGHPLKRVNWRHLHFTISFPDTDTNEYVEYDLGWSGVRANEKIGKPTRVWLFSVTEHDYCKALDRLFVYTTYDKYRATVRALWSAFLYPFEPRIDICTGLVEYVLTGQLCYANVTPAFCNALDEHAHTIYENETIRAGGVGVSQA